MIYKMKGKSQMKNIGRYNGIACYECTYNEYIDVYNKDLDDGKQIFIIDGTMVRQNVIIGQYDGKRVKDLYDGCVYYCNDDVMEFNRQKKAENSKCNEKPAEEVNEKQEGQMTATTYEELVKQDIDFGKYSVVVDEFFALLEA